MIPARAVPVPACAPPALTQRQIAHRVYRIISDQRAYRVQTVIIQTVTVLTELPETVDVRAASGGI